MEQNVRPAGMPWLIPYLIVADADQALDFYEKAFNFQKVNAVPMENGQTGHAEMKYKDQIIMFGREGAHKPDVFSPKTSGQASPVFLYLYCDDVDALFKQAVSAGATVKIEPEESHWGDRMCSLVDPMGHSWCFATHTG